MKPEMTAQQAARPTGAIWIVYFLTALPFGMRTSLVVPAAPAATAAHIVASEALYRASLVSDLVSYGLYIALAYLLYVLLRGVSRPWALIGALFTLVGCFVLVVATAVLTAPLVLLDANVSHVIGLAQRQELALLALKMYGQAYTMALLFFGAQWTIMGPLLVVSRLVPRLIGYLLAVAGVAWIALSVAMLTAPAIGAAMRGVVIPLGGLAEITLALWLLFKGVSPRSVED